MTPEETLAGLILFVLESNVSNDEKAELIAALIAHFNP